MLRFIITVALFTIICSYVNTAYCDTPRHYQATITISTPNNVTTICPGGSLLLTATPTTTGATFQWSLNNIPIVNATQSTYAATAAGTYTVAVTLGGNTDISEPLSLTLLTAPIASFTHSADNQCSALPLTFKSTSSGSNLTYSWDFGDPNSGANNTANIANPNHKFLGTSGTGTQNFTVKLTVTNDQGCSNTFSTSVQMKQSPGTQLTGPSQNYNGQPYFVGCGNGPATMSFGNQSSTKASNPFYRISWGDGSPDFSQATFVSTSHIYAVGNYQLQFIVTGINGCLDTAKYNVFVGGNPAVGLGNPGNTSTCTGSFLTFPVTNTNNNPPGTIYTVTFNDGTPAKVYTTAPDTIMHYFNKSSCGTTSGTYNNSFSATIVASNPCSSSSAVVSPIYVSLKPQANFSSSKTITCINNQITFTNISQSNEVNNGVCKTGKFVWHITPATGWVASNNDLGDDLSGSPDANLWQSGSNSLPVRFTSPGTYTIKLSVGSSNCGNDEITKTVCINPAPVADFTLDVNAGCEPLSVKATNSSPAPNCGTNTYKWTVSPASGYTFTNGTSATSVNPEFLFNNAGTYTLTLITSSPDCNSSPVSKTISVSVKPLVSAIVAPASVCEGGTLSPTSTVTGSGPLTYLWTFQGGTPSTSTSLVPGAITYAVAGTYTTTLAVTNACGTTTVTKSVTVAALPSVNQPGNYVFCAGEPSGLIGFSGSTGSTFSWTNSNSAIGLSSSGTGNIASFNTRNTGSIPLVATITVTPNNGCPGQPLNFTITVNPSPTVASTGPDAQICQTVYQLNGNAPIVGSGIWSQTAGPTASISDVNSRNPTVNDLVKGTRYQWTWTISNANCTPSAKAFNLYVLNDIVNTIKSDAAAACPGQSIHLSTDQLSGGDVPGSLNASYTYLWESSTDGGAHWQSISGSTATSLTVTPTVATMYRRTVSSYNTCPLTSNVLTIGLNAGAPPASVSSPLSVCNQTQAQLNANDPGAGFTGSWTDDAIGSTLTFSPNAQAHDAVVNGLIPGQVYHLTWTITSSSCGITTAKLTLNDLAPVSNTLTNGAGTLCFGQTVSINGPAVTGGSGSYAYSWESSPDQNTWSLLAGQTGTNLTFSASQSAYFRRIVVSGSCSAISNSIQLNVLPPIANNTISAAQQICLGQPIALLNGSAPTGGDGTSYTYQWQQSSDNATWVAISDGQDPNYQPSVLTQTTYYRRLVSSGLCIGALQSTSASIKITISPNAKAEFRASTTSGCVPFKLKNVITPVPHDDLDASYTWYANGAVIGTGSSFPDYTISAEGTTVVIKLVATSKLGCDTNSMARSFSTIPGVSAAFAKDQISGCGPLVTHFTNTSAPITGATYFWSFGNGSTSAQTQPGPVTFSPNRLGRDTTYIITLKAQTSCGITTYSDSVTVKASPKAIFTPDATKGCSPFTIHLTNQSLGVGNQYTFSFGNGDQLTRADNQSIQYTYTTTKTDTLTLKLVATNGCGLDSSSYKIVVYPNTVQANLVVNGDNKSGCLPFAVTFANNSVGANSFFYDFGDGTSASTSQAPELLTHTYTQSGVFTVKMTASNGCSTQATQQIITVLSPPAASFTIPQNQYCAKANISFANTTPDAGNYTFNWDFGDGQTTNEFSPSHRYITSGNYTVRLTALRQAADGTLCTKTVSQLLTIVAPLPAIFDSNSGSLNCSPFVYQVSSRTAASAVAWTFGDPGSIDDQATGASAQHKFSKAGLYRVQMIAYNQNACADTTTQLVKIIESPQPAFKGADTVICGSNASLHFKNTSTYNGSDLVNYHWSVNGVQVSTRQDLDFNFSVPAGANYPYTFRVTLSAGSVVGCADTLSHTVVFNPLPVAQFSVASNVSCAPFSPIISNSSSYADQYQWYLDGVLISTEKVPAGLILKTSNKNYTLKLVTNNRFGCQPDEMSISLSTYPKPLADFSLQDSVSCNGKLDIQVTNRTSGATSYSWDFGDGSVKQTGSVPTHTYSTPGVFPLRLIAYNGICPDTTIHLIKIAQPPKAAFTANSVTGCSSLNLTFQNLSVNAASFLWDFGDGTFSSERNPTHTYTYINSPYTVKLTAYSDYGCSDQAVIINYITVNPAPVVDFTAVPDSIIQIPNHRFNFRNNTTGAISYEWDFGDGKSSVETQASHEYAGIGTYRVKLTATSSEGCTIYRTRTVIVNNAPQYLYVPNAFEPGNAHAELRQFNVRALGLKTYSLRVFNRWGQLLFQTTALDSKGIPSVGWDGQLAGKPAPPGTYVWQIAAWFLDGTEWHGMQYKKDDSPAKTGFFYLIR